MKKSILLILAGLLGGNLTALADVQNAQKLTALEKQQIAWAIRILQFDEDILSVLEAEGHIERGGTHPTTICVGASGITK
jgi:predicted extracellular nuclease